MCVCVRASILVALCTHSFEQETFHRHSSSYILHCVIIFTQLIYVENNAVDTRQFDLWCGFLNKLCRFIQLLMKMRQHKATEYNTRKIWTKKKMLIAILGRVNRMNFAQQRRILMKCRARKKREGLPIYPMRMHSSLKRMRYR